MTKSRNNKTRTKNEFRDNFFVFKWILFISVFLILGGTFAFAMILLFALGIRGSTGMEPLWIVGMIPMMALIAVPLSLLIYRQVKKNLSVLIVGMEKVANGDLETYIPTANAKDFAKVYENFNKMVAEIQGVEAIRVSMFDNLSHELKTPIASINGFARVLTEKDLPEEKKRKYLGIIVNESGRLGDLVKNILLLSKLDSQEIVAHKEEYSLTQQLRDCVISLENDWTAKNIDMSADLDDVYYNGEPQLMKSLWLNLLNNAVKFTPEKGEINIRLTADENNITVVITDTGIGMSGETLEHIFERHYQSDKKIAGAGQGLGLPIVKRIVKLCGGAVSAESREGEGSAFTVVLPK